MKKIIFMSYGMYSGGVEVSLVNLLNVIKNKYDITLLLLKKEGILIDQIPANVKIKEIQFKKEYYNIYKTAKDMPNIKYKILFYKNKIFNKILCLLDLQKVACKYFLSKTIEVNEQYDLAIDYHGYGYFGTPYVAERINAKKKLSWIHSSNLEWTKYSDLYFANFDKLIAVSKYSEEVFKNKYPHLKDKVEVFYNVLDYDNIQKKSNEFKNMFNHDNINILTVGRLEKEKGYDLLLEIAKKLKDNNLKYKWYIIGKGSLKKKIEDFIEKNQLEHNVILLYEKKNPYPYFNECDLYVQTSNFEGYGLTIAEAKLFDKRIVCSNIPTFVEQISDYEKGEICELNSDSFFEKIQELIANYKIEDGSKFTIRNSVIDEQVKLFDELFD